jgi:hypothetical protein
LRIDFSAACLLVGLDPKTPIEIRARPATDAERLTAGHPLVDLSQCTPSADFGLHRRYRGNRFSTRHIASSTQEI